MAYTITSDISRFLEVGLKEVFTKNFEPFPIEYPAFTTAKAANKQTEKYDSVGNLKAAEVKVEGDAITYGKVTQGYQTTITNRTVANGFAISLESLKYDQYGVGKMAEAKELARTMREAEELRAILRLDNAFTTALADGQALCANAKPLLNSVLTNDTLATAASLKTPENHKTAIKMFADFKNHAGGKMKSYPNKGLTHVQNMMDIEEIYGSANKANEISNTKNSLPKISFDYSTYLTSTTAWFLRDTKFDHVLFQTFLATVTEMDIDVINTKNHYFNAIAMYETGVLPNIGIVGNAGA